MVNKITITDSNTQVDYVIDKSNEAFNYLTEILQVKGCESIISDLFQENVHFSEYGLGSILHLFEPDKQMPNGEDTFKEYTKKLTDPSYAAVDLRLSKTENLFEGFNNKIIKSITAKADLIADCSTAISETTQFFIKTFPMFVPNKACTFDPAKWFLYLYSKSKFVCFSKYVAMDINENYLFDALWLKEESERAKMLDLITEYHNAVKSGNGIRIDYAVGSLEEGWFKKLLNKYVMLIQSTAHKIFWTPIAIKLLPVYNRYFGTIPVADWFFYPLFFQIRRYFSKTVPDIELFVGPPIAIKEKPLYPGKVFVEIGVYLRYEAPLFSKQITFYRNEKKY